ncbi:MAG: aldo/keto reductase [Candidatus Kariarchaeaceae archaeon]|jgi:aryl-alcohol dehydrogenase-like predicted oxidoreductase
MMRKLGSYGKAVSAMGLGLWAIGGPFRNKNSEKYFAYGDVDDQESIRVIQKALEMGINFFDTADVYGTGHSETVFGQVIKEIDRQEIVIATKFGSTFEEGKRLTLSDHRADPEYIREAIEGSCRRLQTDFIDLYQLHWYNLPLEEAAGVRDTLEDLVQEGRIGGYGWSTDDPERARIFAEGENCIAMQYVLNLARANTKMLELCEQKNLGSVIRGPLNYGLLTGKYSANTTLPNNHLLHGSNFAEGRLADIRESLDKVKEILTEDGRTLVQAALGYIWAESETTIPIPGAKTLKQIEENAAALELGALTPHQVSRINSLFGEVRTEFVEY